MKLPIILAALLTAATPASARNIVDWQCGEIEASLTVTAAHKTSLDYLYYSIDLSGFRNPPNLRFKWIADPRCERGEDCTNGKAYLNGKPCKEIPYDQNADDEK